MYYPNQKQITIKRDTVQQSKSTGKYVISYQMNLEDAMKRLTSSAFKVYVYLLFNKDNYTIEYSPEHISKTTGICKDSARKAFVQLEQLGYLKQIEEHRYIFRESLYMPFEEKRRDSSYGYGLF